jgi:hypothetical protein
MANVRQLEVLRRGMDAWDRWRAANPNVRPDLTGADFSPFEVLP